MSITSLNHKRAKVTHEILEGCAKLLRYWPRRSQFRLRCYNKIIPLTKTMGIKGLSTPYIRNNPTSVNSSLKDIRRTAPSKNVIGIDMSTIFVTAIKASPTLIERFHCRPPVPIHELVNKMTDTVGRCVNEGFFVVCVFDGLTHLLKKMKAHVERYDKTEEWKKRLDEIYLISSYDTIEKEKAAFYSKGSL